jgi:hypothetical protein
MNCDKGREGAASCHEAPKSHIHCGGVVPRRPLLRKSVKLLVSSVEFSVFSFFPLSFSPVGEWKPQTKIGGRLKEEEEEKEE